ncbi:MAG: hypothetical protein HC908_05030 [Calothrix sp. SM1_7_51]|nr:hypothetical protein [Calothrix sp. SM1_7_51]
MVEKVSLQSHKSKTLEDTKFAHPSIDIRNNIVISAKKNQEPEISANNSVDLGACICLNLEELKCFETVEHQYERWGVVFHNCIAIQPSNPAFKARSGLVVLMGAPKNGYMEASFMRPVCSVSTYVTSSRQLVFSAYDRNRHLLAQNILPGANLANTDSVVAPNTLLTVKANNIHRITLCAFDGQFTIDDFTFCF